jgi:hypothetical protein
LIQRLPLSFDPVARFPNHLPSGDPEASLDRTQFSRPEGSFAARSFGNVLHACIEFLTSRIASGDSPSALLAGLPAWSPRIHALLRADGLPHATISRLARETSATLENLLRDPDGQWLLAPHLGASTEFSLTTALTGQPVSVRPVSVRLDRIFRAGPAPHATGSDHLWIVDYKSASHSTKNIDEFFATQRATYSQQLEAYARILAPTQSIASENVRLALYFPALASMPRLLWWPFGDASQQDAPDYEPRPQSLVPSP